MLFEEFQERRNGDVKGIGAIVLLQSFELGDGFDALGSLVFVDLGLRLGVDVIEEGPESFGLGVVEESAFLEEEGEVRLVADL